MTNIRKILQVIFKNNDFKDVINKYLKEEEIFSKLEFLKLFSYHYPTLYNKNEISNLQFLAKNSWGKSDEKYSIYNLLTQATESILIEKNKEVICKYEELLRWRELSYQLGEDIFVTSFLAKKDLFRYEKRDFFSWSPIISNDNKRLYEVLKKGVAENHFHLKGSSPHFQLNWIYLMNNIKRCHKELDELDKKLNLSANISINSFEKNNYLEKFSDFIKIAVGIRIYFFIKIKKLDKDNDKKIKNLLESKYTFEIDDKIKNFLDIMEITKDKYSKKIKEKVIDYWIPYNINKDNLNENLFLTGERIFLYEMFYNIFSNNFSKREEHLFYLYLIIKQKFRGEFIQINNEIGFGNFGDYQDRKGMFLIDKLFKDRVNYMAVKSFNLYKNTNKLEARIAPIEKLKELRYYDDSINNDLLKENELKLELDTDKNQKNKFFYTIHFIKKPENIEDIINKSIEKSLIECRNYSLRIELEKTTNKIIKLKNENTYFRERVLGIDAANVEIGCRPEVLAVSFRKLQENDNINKFKSFGRTYHVGEEFLDILDGLRAIDECILFLNFKSSDRLGHALALGISPQKYYSSKENILLLTKHNVLDNIAWAYSKIKEFNLNVSSSFLVYLRNLFEKYIVEIYMDSGISIETYYNSWKLRGDDPQMYNSNGNYNENNCFSNLEEYRKNNIPEVNISRNNKFARQLYYRYHYDPKVKINGSKIEEFYITQEYINLVEEIQKKMQNRISRMGIFIETNPSSNYLIGTIDKYIEHPIIKFYNLSLTTNFEELKKSPQLCVSVNTDDQGVFGTSLDNEYGLLALALEKEKDEYGEYKYNPTLVYEWVDKIREMGLMQSFSDE